MQFSKIIGQTKVKEHLIKSVQEGRISHAQLFVGQEGAGALALAVAYAQYINCRRRTVNDSCSECDNCRKYEKLQHPDLHFSFPYAASDKDDIASNYLKQWRSLFEKNIYFGLDDWRETLAIEKKAVNINAAECHHILSKLSLKAFEAPYKIQIIWLPEFLGKESNRLLKIIEEPPAYTLFILVAEQSDKLLNTILSRTQLLKIPKYSTEECARFLNEQCQISENQAHEIAFLADGNMAAALHRVQNANNPTSAEFMQWLRNCFKSTDLIKAIDFGDDFAKRSRDEQKNFFLYGLNFLREVLLIAQGASVLVRLNAEEKSTAEKLATKVMDSFMIAQMTEELEKAIYHIERNANSKILFLDVSLRLHLTFSKHFVPQKTIDFLTIC